MATTDRDDADVYGHGEVMPSAENVERELGMWEDALARLSAVVREARALRQRREDSARDVRGWRYSSTSVDACDNEDCPMSHEPGAYSRVASRETRGTEARVEQEQEQEESIVNTLCTKCFSQATEIGARELMYERETWRQKVARASDEDEWRFVRYNDSRVTRDDVRCLFEECWFKNHVDRLGAYKGTHVLRGADCMIAICEVCWDNESTAGDEVVEAIKLRFQPSDERARERKQERDERVALLHRDMADERSWKDENRVGSHTCVCGTRCQSTRGRSRPMRCMKNRLLCMCDACWKAGRWKERWLAELLVGA
jgi:hypothetical protein